MDDIFKKTIELVRKNPADFQKTIQSITKKILKNNHPLNIGKVAKRFYKIWPDSRGKKVIVIGWLLSDSAIGTGMPSVPTALAEILTKRLSNADKKLNPANPQEWIQAHIFHQEESKQRLEDAVRAYETENPLKDESDAGTAEQKNLKDIGQNSGKAGEDRPKGTIYNKTALALATLQQHPDWTDEQIAKEVGVNRTTLYDWPDFKKAKEILKQGKNDIPKGSKNGETGDIEAWEKEQDQDEE
jgi:hypothetical protein